MPSSAELLDAAFRLHQSGALDRAEPIYRQLVAADPRSAQGWHLLGVVAQQTGRPREAIDLIGQAIRLDPRNATYFNHLGAAYGAAGEIAEAVSCFRAALRFAPGDPQAHYNLAAALALQEEFKEAEAEYRAAIHYQPDFREAHFNLANLLRDVGRLDEAVPQYRQAIAHKADYAEAHTNLGAVLTTLGKVDSAVAILRRSLAIKDSIKGRVNLGSALTERRDLDEAVALLREAAASGESAEAHNNLAVALMYQGRLDEALDSSNRAIALAPEYAEAHANRAAIWLFQGDYERGWPEYEWRFQSKDYAPNPFRYRPTWDGGDATGKTILLHSEQGLGDAIQFVRFAPLVKASGARVMVRCPPALESLLADAAGVDEFSPHNGPVPAFDLQASLMSLPAITKATLASVGDSAPYLHADPRLVERWRGELTAIEGFRIGVAWQGNPNYRGDRYRSIPLAQFAPLAAVPGARLVSVQRGAGLEQLSAIAERFSVVDLGPAVDTEAGPFMDTAAIMANLDLVVTSDTALAHLAGALGAKVWLGLAAPCEWRWLSDRDDSPWYPTMRVFRQARPGDWSSVFTRMAVELPKLIASGSNR